MNHTEENNLLFNSFLGDYFWEPFRKGEREIELIISPECNLACSYCYINKYACKTFASSIFDNSNVLGNLDKILNWMHTNKFTCVVSIFSGELFAQEIGYQVLERIHEFYKDKEIKISGITIPTNFTFINSDECTERIEKLIKRFNEIDIRIYLSPSFDGKYMEQNRPYKKDLDIKLDKPRDDEYYDKVFQFSKKHGCGFHPMVHAKGIENWIQNFNWFQDMMSKHGIHWSNIYLLQVRNDGWTEEKNRELYKFIQYLIDFAFDKCERDKDKFVQFLLKGQNGFNILSEMLVDHTRGIGCSIQTSFGIRVSDLKQFPCHRLMYPSFQIGQMVDDEENVLRYETKNAELGLTIYGFNTKSQPLCITCPINRLCIGGCLGSQFETNKDIFTPIKSVCSNSWWITKALIDGFQRIEVLDGGIIPLISKYKKSQIELVRRVNVNEN